MTSKPVEISEAMRKIALAMTKPGVTLRCSVAPSRRWFLNFPDGSQRYVNARSAENMLVAGLFARTARYYPLRDTRGHFLGYYSLEHKLSAAGRAALQPVKD